MTANIEVEDLRANNYLYATAFFHSQLECYALTVSFLERSGLLKQNAQIADLTNNFVRMKEYILVRFTLSADRQF